MRKREKYFFITGFFLAWVYWASIASARAGLPFEAPLKAALERAAATAPGRVEVEILAAEPPPALAGCRQVEPFIPEGVRPWGRTTIGARCIDGGTGAAFIPVHVRVHGTALVAARALPAGQAVDAADVAVAEVELSAQPAPLASRAEQAVGRILARPVAAGSPLRLDGLRAPTAVAAGDIVRVVYRGEGFSVSTEGKSLGSAADGQPVRVQTESGRTLSGTARPGRVVEIRGF